MESQQFCEPGCQYEQSGIRQQHLNGLLDGRAPDHIEREDSLLAPVSRRSFLKRAATGLSAGFLIPKSFESHIQHVILVVPGGARKQDYYQNASLAPNIGQLAAEGFVFEEDHCDTVTSHRSCFGELVQGLPDCLYVNDGSRVNAVLQEFRPKVLVVREMAHDKGHDDYEEYLEAIRQTDRNVGRIVACVRSDAFLKENTAIVIRPEFGRDGIVNRLGQLHHSPGFYCAHRVASIFWGPGVKRGVERNVVDRRDLGRRIASLIRRSPGAPSNNGPPSPWERE